MPHAEPLESLLNERDTLVVERSFTGELPPDASMDGLELEGCSLQVCRWQGRHMVGASFAECGFVDCDLSGIALEGVAFRECSFRGIKALGVDWTAAGVSTLAAVPMTWQDCTLDFSTLGGVTMSGWTFHGCALRETHLVRSDLRRARFVECDFTGATIAECDLRGASMTDCTGVVFDPRSNQVQGLTISASMAADLLLPLGITVR